MEEHRPDPDNTVLAEQFVLEFQQACQRGEPPRLEEFVERISPEVRHVVLPQLISLDMQQRNDEGEKPSLADYLNRLPSFQPTITAAFESFHDTISSNDAERDPALGSTEVDIAVGESLGKYELRSVLGVGGMGVVFGAFDTVIQREVAIKLLSTKHSSNATALQRLLQEAQAAGSLHHSNIVGIYDVLEKEGAYYVVMEKVNGANLSQVLMNSPNGVMDWKQATRIMMDCCDALLAAHQRGMIHRDIKPQNVMLTEKSNVKLLDFGLAKSEQSGDSALTQEGAILGTPDYMSPEQCGAGEVSTLSDIYSLGATYYTLLTGKPPFEAAGNPLKVIFAHCNTPTPHLDNAAIPDECDQIIQRAMAKVPQDRFASAAEMKSTLSSVFQHGDSPPQPALSATEQTLPKRQLWKTLVALGLIAGVISVLFSVFMGAWQNRNGSDASSSQKTLQDVTTSAFKFRGVTADKIHLGTTTAYNGPNEELGRNMVVGMRTYFSYVNDTSGIHGRKIDLTVLDDRYDPDRALANMQELFEERKVFAVIGNVGTPTARVTARYASENQFLFFGPFTGASLLREDPSDRYVFNYRASYADETAAMVSYFVETLDISADQIGVFAQNDSYGDDGFAGVARAMHKYGVDAQDILRVGYNRNQLNIDSAVEQILTGNNDIRAIVMVPTYKVAARFVRRIRAERPEMVFGAVSFVGSRAFAEEFKELGPASGEGVIVTQVVPPYMSNSTGVRQYRDLLKRYNPEYEPGFVSLEGFIVAAIFVEGLRLAGHELTTESLVDALHDIDGFDLGIGPVIEFSPSRHQASHRIWGTVLDADAEFQTLDLEP